MPDDTLATKFIYDASTGISYRPDDVLPDSLIEKLPQRVKRLNRDTGKKWTPVTPIQNPSPPNPPRDPVTPIPPQPPPNRRISAGAQRLIDEHGLDADLIPIARADGLMTVRDVRDYMRDNG